jgi:D-alanyl-D-alanine carboxypeptidase
MSKQQQTIQQQAAKHKKKEAYIVVSITVILLVMLCFSGYFVAKHIAQKKIEEARIALELQERAEQLALEKKHMEAKRVFTDVSVAARAAYVYDINNAGLLYQKNSGEKLGIASITKVMTALTAIETIGSDALVQINWMHVQTEGESGLIPGEYFTVTDLINYMLVNSSNDSAAALAQAAGAFLIRERGDTNLTAEQMFVAERNALATVLGMHKTTFTNPTGLDENYETQIGAYSSAEDVAVLFQYILEHYPDLLSATKESIVTITSREGYPHVVENTNDIITSLPNITASKTGYTVQAGGNLAVVINPELNNPFIIVVLGSTKEGRFSDVQQLSEAVVGYVAKKKILGIE